MKRVLLVLPLVAGTAVAADAIDTFFDRFTAEWVRADPNLATRTQYFSGAEQEKLDAQLTPVGAAFRKQRVDMARRALAELRRFDRTRFTPTQRTSARTLEWQLDAVIRAAEFDSHRYIFSQIFGQPGQLVSFLTDNHPARNSRDAANYLSRLGQVAAQLDEMTAEAAERAGRGFVPPRFILTATIGQIERLVQPAPAKSVLVELYVERMAKAGIAEAERARVRAFAEELVRTQINPALRRVIALLERQHEKGTDEAGISKLPGGLDAYANRLRQMTSTAMTADQIHRTGLEQVARIENRMDEVLRRMGYRDGTVKERYAKAGKDHSYPASPNVRETILADYDKMIRDAERRSDALFDVRPKAPIVVRRIPEYAERNAAANYNAPARDGSRPGRFNVPLVGPTFSKLGMRTLANHEGVPGHHFQIALIQENTELPRFRSDMILREGGGAMAEGWALYTETLALENGWYDGDLPSELGALNSQLFRARRLVVDTGLHAKGWTRQQGIDYGISASEVERYVVGPGQACSYMIGQLKIQEMRDKARRELGDKFQIKEFHNVVLRTGLVPLEVLEEVVADYIRSKH